MVSNEIFYKNLNSKISVSSLMFSNKFELNRNYVVFFSFIGKRFRHWHFTDTYVNKQFLSITLRSSIELR